MQTLRFLNYWLRAIELHASGALVALVGTKRDTIPVNQDRDGKSVGSARRYNDSRASRSQQLGQSASEKLVVQPILWMPPCST